MNFVKKRNFVLFVVLGKNSVKVYMKQNQNIIYIIPMKNTAFLIHCQRHKDKQIKYLGIGQTYKDIFYFVRTI